MLAAVTVVIRPLDVSLEVSGSADALFNRQTFNLPTRTVTPGKSKPEFKSYFELFNPASHFGHPFLNFTGGKKSEMWL